MNRDGFTIVEVIIFLAISGLMLTMAMIGSGNLARQARFSDSVNSLHSVIQREYEEVVNGVNIRPSSDAGCTGGPAQQTGTDDCVLLGKVISFNQNGGTTVVVRYVTDDPTPPYTTTGTIYQQINAAQPQLSTSNVRTYDLSWGASFQTASRASAVTPPDLNTQVKTGSSQATINNIAFLRSPSGSQIVPYYFYSNDQTGASIQTNLREAVADYPRSAGTQAYVCIYNTQDWVASTSPVASITFGVGQGSVAIDTDFAPTRSNVMQAECGL